MVFMGLLMVTGKMNDMSRYLSGISSISGTEKGNATKPEASETTGGEEGEVPKATDAESTMAEEQGEKEEENETKAENMLPPAVDFELQDQYGNLHTLKDYEGKTIFLNFWATWCPPCRAEMPDIQKLYENYSREGDEALIVLGVAAPEMGQEKSEEEIKAFLEENGYTYPVLMDLSGELFYQYGIQAFPTTFMIDRDGNIFGYISGQLTMEMMESIISQTMEGKRKQ